MLSNIWLAGTILAFIVGLVYLMKDKFFRGMETSCIVTSFILLLFMSLMWPASVPAILIAFLICKIRNRRCNDD